jgi:hypothetical protein
MTREKMHAFAIHWADAWNERNIEAVLKHFEDNVVFASPTALAVVGAPVIYGKDALRQYWSAALGRICSLFFRVERVLWDPTSRELAILYVGEIDGKARKVSENLIFNAAGRVVSAEVFHGIPS